MLSRTKHTPRLALAAAFAVVSATAVAVPPAQMARLSGLNLPLSFEKNTGHWPKGVEFVARGGGGTLFLTRREAILSLRKGDKAAALRLKLQGSNGGAVASGLEKQPGIVNYFIGKDPAGWRTQVPTYSRVKLAGVYRGIDLVYYGAGKSRTLEYDFVVKPGADPKQIRMAISGAKSLRTAGGRLIASTACGDVTLNRPYAYQTIGGVRRQVACSFTLERNTVAFQVARYDASRPLVVDPTLAYGSYLGEAGQTDMPAIAVDSSGAAYVVGGTSAATFPTTVGAYDTSYNDAGDAHITKLNAAGTALVYSTYLGGASDDQAYSIAVDAAGAAYVTGSTASLHFPVTNNAYDGSFTGSGDCFITKIGAAGAALEYSTFLGGTGADCGRSIAIDSSGAAYVTGYTLSDGFPTTVGAYDTSFNGFADVFVTKLNSTGTALVYSTYMGAVAYDTGTAIVVDATGSACVAGYTSSGTFPTTLTAYDRYHGGAGYDAFVAMFTPTGAALTYSTLLGDTGSDQAYGVAIDGDGRAIVVGNTTSSAFPTTPGAYDRSHNGSKDAFITKVNATGTALIYSTFYGGPQDDSGLAVALDSTGAVTIVGATTSGVPSVPTTADAYDATHNGLNDAFVARLNAAGTELAYGTLLGGASFDAAYGVAVDSSASAYIAGITTSADLPVTAGAYDTTPDGTTSGFVAKLSFAPPAAPTTITADAVTCLAFDSITLTGTLTKTSDSSAVSGKTIQFKIGDAGTWTNATAATGADGKATLSVFAPMTAGAYTIYVRFEGDADYAASDASNTLTVTERNSTTLRMDAATATTGSRTTLRARLTDAGGSPVVGRRIRFKVGALADVAAEIPTTADGYATVTITAGAAGGCDVQVWFEGDAQYAATDALGGLTITDLQATTLTVPRILAAPGSEVRLFAYLRTDAGSTTVGPGIAGKQIEFRVNREPWAPASGLTDATGKASLTITAPPAGGTSDIEARFAGDATNAPCNGTGALVVAAKRNVYIYTLNRSVAAGGSTKLVAYLYWYQTNGTLTPLSGQSLRLQCAGAGLDSSVTTDASGKATVSVTPATAGAHPFTVTFTADADYNAGSGGGTLTVAP
jgi:hypothetical protein